MRAEVCSRCGQEVRYGTRGDVTGWLHREQVDHIVRFGTPWGDGEAAREVERNAPRTRPDTKAIAGHCPTYAALWPLEVYTSLEHDIMRDPVLERRRHRLAALRGEDPDYIEPLPPVETPAHPVEVESFPPRSGIRQILNLIEKTDGWDTVRLTAARGPYVGSRGECLSISDSVVLGARGPEVDGCTRVAVASWRDGAFDTAWIGLASGGTMNPTAANSKALKAWIKDAP